MIISNLFFSSFYLYRYRINNSWKEVQNEMNEADIAFINQHVSQLKHISIPNVLWKSIALKFQTPTSPTYDTQDVFALGIVDNDAEGEDGQGGNNNNVTLEVVATRNIRAFENVWLIQHVWTWQGGMAHAIESLSSSSNNEKGLFNAISNTVLPMNNNSPTKNVAAVVHQVEQVAQTYSVANENGEPVECWFLIDTLGCHLKEVSTLKKKNGIGIGINGEKGNGKGDNDDATCNVILTPAFIDIRTGIACSFIFPIRDMKEGDVVRLPSRSRVSLSPKKDAAE